MFLAIIGVQNALKIYLFLGLFPSHLFIDSLRDFSTFGTSKSLFSHGSYCNNRFFMEIVFKRIRERILVFVGCLGIRFSDILSLENKLENETIFEIPNLK